MADARLDRLVPHTGGSRGVGLPWHPVPAIRHSDELHWESGIFGEGVAVRNGSILPVAPSFSASPDHVRRRSARGVVIASTRRPLYRTRRRAVGSATAGSSAADAADRVLPDQLIADKPHYVKLSTVLSLSRCPTTYFVIQQSATTRSSSSAAASADRLLTLRVAPGSQHR